MKTKYYKVVEFDYMPDGRSFLFKQLKEGVAVFDTAAEAEQFIHNYKGGYFLLAIIPVWE